MCPRSNYIMVSSAKFSAASPSIQSSEEEDLLLKSRRKVRHKEIDSTAAIGVENSASKNVELKKNLESKDAEMKEAL